MQENYGDAYPGKRGIYKRSTQQAWNYWEPDVRWDDYWIWDGWQLEERAKRAEQVRKNKAPDYKHPDLEKYHPDLEHLKSPEDLEKFKQDCWVRRRGGMWFSNAGKATYISGRHWYYLSCIKMANGKLPDYRYADRLVWFFWEYCAEDPKSFGMLYLTGRRSGKCFGIDTSIRMYDGSVKMVQDIAEGEQVMGDDSTPRTVFGVTTGEEQMFRIVPHKGVSFTCNESHILSLIWNGSDYSPRGWKRDGVVNITVREYLMLSGSLKKHLVLYRTGWEAQEQSNVHELPPYMLGLWLGDGGTDSGKMSIADPEIREYITDYAESKGLILKYLSKYDYAITKPQRGCRCSVEIAGTPVEYNSLDEMRTALGLNPDFRPLRNPDFVAKHKFKQLNDQSNCYTDALRRISVLGDKHIPRDYIIDSRANRLQLLAGLLDTDGHAAKAKKSGIATGYEIIQKSKKLADGVVELGRSLGFYVSHKLKIATMKRADGTIYRCEVSRMTICGDVHEIPCLVERKKIACKDKRVNVQRTGFAVEGIGEGQYYGFGVAGNNLFLLEDGTVVHNTAIGGTIPLEEASRTNYYKAGIQSKTLDDAKEVYEKAVINPYRSLPLFFQPTTNLPAGGDLPASGLLFTSGKVARGKKELGSRITFRSSKETGYDSQELQYYFGDEEGKTTESNVEVRWEIVRPCLINHRGDKVGRAYHATTVEEMDAGGQAFLNMWNGSDQNKRGETGETETGLYRMFMPMDMWTIDKYGNPLREEGRMKIIARRNLLRHNPRKLSAEIRKFALTEDEAFSSDASRCVFGNPVIMNDRYSVLKVCPPNYKVGNFQWRGGIRDTFVEFVECANGRFQIAHLLSEEMSNRVRTRGANWTPLNKSMFCAGIDPVDHKTLAESSRNGSNPCIVVVKKYAVGYESDVDESIACLYLTRPNDPETFYEDVIMCLRYYGCEALIEDQKPGIIYHLENRGHAEFAALLPDRARIGKRGISASPKVISYLTELLDQNINECIDNLMFPEVVDQLLKFQPGKTTDYDAVMAFGYALTLRNGPLGRVPEKSNMPQIKDIMPGYRPLKAASIFGRRVG